MLGKKERERERKTIVWYGLHYQSIKGVTEIAKCDFETTSSSSSTSTEKATTTIVKESIILLIILLLLL